MILGCSYNIFDGLELLESSIKSIRNSVDHINVIYQTTSNFGLVSEVNTELILKTLKSNGLIDSYNLYNPKVGNGHYNELEKRNQGLAACRAAGCSHFMTIDADELYLESEFNYAKKVIETGNYDSSACQMQTYYKTAEWALDPPEVYYVPLIYKIDDRKFTMGRKWNIDADPTRRMDQKSIILFTRGEIQMHHFSYVRKNLRSKLENSSAKTNFRNRVDVLVDYYNKWTPGQPGLMAGLRDRFVNLKKVNNIFSIDI